MLKYMFLKIHFKYCRQRTNVKQFCVDFLIDNFFTAAAALIGMVETRLLTDSFYDLTVHCK